MNNKPSSRRDAQPERLKNNQRDAQIGRLYKGKYRIPSIRLKNYDYSSDGSYFVTICTHDHYHYFGKITEGKMHFSEIGKIANQYWIDIPKHFPSVILGEWVVMPNHIHGIIIINPVETPNLDISANPHWKTGSLGNIINQYKRICTIEIRKILPDFAWQSRFYEHIIRNENDFYRTSEYIFNNPLSWQEDKYYE